MTLEDKELLMDRFYDVNEDVYKYEFIVWALILTIAGITVPLLL